MVVLPVTFDPTAFQGMITAFSKTLTYIPVTKTTNNINGQETLADGTPTSIQGHLFQKKNTYYQQKYGLVGNGDGVLLVLPGVVINKNDKVVFDGNTYRIDNVTERYLDQTQFYTQADVFLTDF